MSGDALFRTICLSIVCQTICSFLLIMILETLLTLSMARYYWLPIRELVLVSRDGWVIGSRYFNRRARFIVPVAKESSPSGKHKVLNFVLSVVVGYDSRHLAVC